MERKYPIFNGQKPQFISASLPFKTDIRSHTYEVEDQNSKGSMKYFFTIILVGGLIVSCTGQQTDNHNITFKNAVSLNIGGTTPFIGITYERLLSDRFNFEVGIGAVSVGTAIKYFPWPISDNKMVFHLVLGTNIFKTPLDDFGQGEVSSTTFLTIGLTYIGIGRFSFSIDAGLGLNYDFTYAETTLPPYGGLKIGYRF